MSSAQHNKQQKHMRPTNICVAYDRTVSDYDVITTTDVSDYDVLTTTYGLLYETYVSVV